MTGAEYVAEAARTASAERDDLTHYALGVCTEAGEIAHEAKAHTVYGKALDRTAVVEELGDLCWYMANMIRILDSSWEEVWAKNVEKLRRRYPDGFEKDRALTRNLDAERAALETAPGTDS